MILEATSFANTEETIGRKCVRRTASINQEIADLCALCMYIQLVGAKMFIVGDVCSKSNAIIQIPKSI